MARARNIKPGFFKNDLLSECEPLARILFAGLWTIADREGRLENRPKVIRAECLPHDECDVEFLIAQLDSKGFISRYEVNGRKYMQIINFGAHQNPHIKEPPSTIPPPVTVRCKNRARTRQTPVAHGSSRADSLNPITDSITSSMPSGAAPLPAEFLESPDFVTALKTFETMRREIKKPIRQLSVGTMCKKFIAWGLAGSIESLENSVANQWQGIFEPKRRASSQQPVQRDLASELIERLNAEDASNG